MVQFQDAPLVDGVLTLTETQVLSIRNDLRSIQEGFVPNVNMAYCAIHYIVDKYNEKSSSLKINGDTASYILSYMTEEEMKSQDFSVAE